jgi:predicted ABC-type ATPase
MSDENPQIIIIAGPNGAGKSTLAPFLLRDTFGLLEYVNADTIALGLSAFNSESMAFEADASCFAACMTWLINDKVSLLRVH